MSNKLSLKIGESKLFTIEKNGTFKVGKCFSSTTNSWGYKIDVHHISSDSTPPSSITFEGTGVPNSDEKYIFKYGTSAYTHNIDVKKNDTIEIKAIYDGTQTADDKMVIEIDYSTP